MAHLPRYLHAEPLQPGQLIPISAERAHHLYTVLRRREGDQLRVWNGQGSEADACIETLNKNGGTAKLGATETVCKESPLQIILVQALSRGDRFERALMAGVELGVRAVQPVWCEHGPGIIRGPRLQKKQRAWAQLALGAAEQAERSRLPEVLPASDFLAWLGTPRGGYFLDPSGSAPSKASMDTDMDEGPIHVLVGPEGGFSDRERSAAQRAGLMAMRLGPRILRTEHAGAAAIAVLQSLWGDLLA